MILVSEAGSTRSSGFFDAMTCPLVASSSSHALAFGAGASGAGGDGGGGLSGGARLSGAGGLRGGRCGGGRGGLGDTDGAERRGGPKSDNKLLHKFHGLKAITDVSLSPNGPDKVQRCVSGRARDAPCGVGCPRVAQAS